MNIKLSTLAHLNVCEEYVHIALNEESPVLSSAVLNGGSVRAKHLVNLKVDKDSATEEAPETTLSKYCDSKEWQGERVGLMTAASMKSFRMAHEHVQGIDIFAMVTSGLNNARRVGDKAEYRDIYSFPYEIGTINTFVLTNAVLSESARLEAMMIATEAKVAALNDANILSPISKQLATGTGTDAMALASASGKVNVNYCGKHVLFGEVLGRLVYEAVSDSISWKAKK